jgi:hypothetical protein
MILQRPTWSNCFNMFKDLIKFFWRFHILEVKMVLIELPLFLWCSPKKKIVSFISDDYAYVIRLDEETQLFYHKWNHTIPCHHLRLCYLALLSLSSLRYSGGYWPVVFLQMQLMVTLRVALIKFRKITTFHTYAAKLAAILRGTFLILLFFCLSPFIFCLPRCFCYYL